MRVVKVKPRWVHFALYRVPELGLPGQVLEWQVFGGCEWDRPGGHGEGRNGPGSGARGKEGEIRTTSTVNLLAFLGLLPLLT